MRRRYVLTALLGLLSWRPAQSEHNDRGTATEDPVASDLHPEALLAYRAANSDYRQMAGHVDPYIDINGSNGRRSLSDQVRLYDEFLASQYGGPPAPRANQPGKSLHQYGLAIDVVRLRDEERIRRALLRNGWAQEVEGEAWHFEATGTAAYATAVSKIASDISPAAQEYANARNEVFAFGRLVRDKGPAIQAEAAAVRRERRDLQEARRPLQEQYLELRRAGQAARRASSNFKSVRQRENTLRQRLATFEYTYCPNGRAYRSCSHRSQKARYDRERRELESLIRNTSRQAQDLRREYSKRYQEYQNIKNTYTSKRREFEKLLGAFKKRAGESRKQDSRLRRWKQKIQENSALSRTRLKNLTSLVDALDEEL